MLTPCGAPTVLAIKRPPKPSEDPFDPENFLWITLIARTRFGLTLVTEKPSLLPDLDSRQNSLSLRLAENPLDRPVFTFTEGHAILAIWN